MWYGRDHMARLEFIESKSNRGDKLRFQNMKIDMEMYMDVDMDVDVEMDMNVDMNEDMDVG
jgi:hypothetical protein